MRRSYRIALSALLLVMLAACTFVYSSTVTVKISGIEGTADDYPTVYVYAFTDSAAWERAYQLISAKAAEDGQEPGAFEDYLASLMPDGCYQMQTATYAETTILGNVSGTAVSFRIYWETSKPEFGEDADRALAYFIAASEKSDGSSSTRYVGTQPYTMVSGGSNTTTVNMEEI